MEKSFKLSQMTSIKLNFRPSAVADHEGTLYYQIIHDRKMRQLISGYRIFPDEWDGKHSAIIVQDRNGRRASTLSIRNGAMHDINRLKRICLQLEAIGQPYTVDDIIVTFTRYMDEYSLFSFMKKLIYKLRRNGRIRTSETYSATLSNFRKFLACQSSIISHNAPNDIMLDCLTSEIMEAYEAWNRRRGITSNTISFYNRIIRAVYNRAVEEGIIEDQKPFRHVYTGIDKTVKRALPLKIIRKIKMMNLSQSHGLDFARDMFMMSFYLRGMSFIDMAYLKKSNLRDGHITYRRRKTGQQLTIKWTEEMQEILGKYHENQSDFLLPIIRTSDADERCTYRNMSYNINHNLNRIAMRLDIDFRLTMYVARHSWASAAKVNGIPLSVISEGMGHDSETTTRIYLASLDTSVIDKANTIILKSLE